MHRDDLAISSFALLIFLEKAVILNFGIRRGTQVVKGGACKALIRRFESGPRLFFIFLEAS